MKPAISYDDENLPKQKINQFDFFDDTDYDDCINITETNKLKSLKKGYYYIKNCLIITLKTVHQKTIL